jgi:UDPglucose 6-dehydrogenase
MWCLTSKAYANQELPKAINLVNNWQTARLYNLIVKEMKGKKSLGILGLAFKPDTDVVEESPGWELWQKATNKKWKILAYDQVVKCECSTSTAQECVDKSDVIVLTLPIDYEVEFKENQTVIDCWRMIDKEDVPGRYIAIGIGR